MENHLKLAIIDVLGLSYDGSTLEKRGLGGSESATIRISRELVKLGINVTVYNDCESDDCNPGIYDGVNYLLGPGDRWPLSDGFFDAVVNKKILCNVRL